MHGVVRWQSRKCRQCGAIQARGQAIGNKLPQDIEATSVFGADEDAWRYHAGRPLDGVRQHAGLGSGLEVVLPGGLWTNVPVTERFAQQSPYVLHRKNGSYVLHLGDEAVTTLERAHVHVAAVAAVAATPSPGR